MEGMNMSFTGFAVIMVFFMTVIFAQIRIGDAATATMWFILVALITILSHKQAIAELIKTKKFDEKIRQINLYIRGICRD